MTTIQTTDLARDALYTKVNIMVGERADKSLSNLDSTGQMIIDSANGTISNCILEIPQNIKLTLENNVVTLKAGSIVTKTGSTYETITLLSDLVRSSTTFTPNRTNIVFTTNGTAFAMERVEKIGSGATLPADDSQYTWFFNTTDKKMYWWNNGNFVESNLTYPICIIDVDADGNASFAKDSNGNDMIFNGAGFIGHHAFVYPNVKSLIPNGFNSDGTLKSILINTNALIIRELSNGSTLGKSFTSDGVDRWNGYIEVETYDDFLAQYSSYIANTRFYVKELNKTFVYAGESIGILEQKMTPLVYYSQSSNIVTDFTIRQPVRTATVEMLDKIDSSVVHTSGDEVINDTKSFYVIKSKNSSYTGTYEGYYYQQGGGELVQGLRAGSTWLNYIQYRTDGSIHFSGTVNVSTPADGDNSTKAATTAFVNNYFTAITGYDATKTQTLKNVSGTLTWVDD